VPGTPEQILDRGILELQFHAKRKGDALRSSFLSAAQSGRTTQAPGSSGRLAPGSSGRLDSSWGKGGQQMSKTVPSGRPADVLTIDSRPNTSGQK